MRRRRRRRNVWVGNGSTRTKTGRPFVGFCTLGRQYFSPHCYGLMGSCPCDGGHAKRPGTVGEVLPSGPVGNGERTCSWTYGTRWIWHLLLWQNCHTAAVTVAAAAPSIRFYPRVTDCCASAPQLSLSIFTSAILPISSLSRDKWLCSARCKLQWTSKFSQNETVNFLWSPGTIFPSLFKKEIISFSLP